MTRNTGRPTGRPTTTPWGRLIRKAVTDGPVAYEALVLEASRLVPPGKAYRKRVEQEKSIRSVKGVKTQRKFKDPEYDEKKKDRYIQAGSKLVVRETIRGLVRMKRLEFVDRDGERLLMLGPNAWTEPPPELET